MTTCVSWHKEIQSAGEKEEERMRSFVRAVHEVLPASGFNVFQRAVKSGREGESVTDWTDLHGFQKRKLVEELPDKYLGIIQTNNKGCTYSWRGQA